MLRAMRTALARETVILLADRSAPLQYGLFGLSAMLVAAASLDQRGMPGATALIGANTLVLFFTQTLMVEAVHRSDFASGLWQRIRLHQAVVPWYFGKIISLSLLVGLLAVPLLWLGGQFLRVALPGDVYWQLPLCSGVGAVGFFALALVLLPVAAATGRRALFLPLLLFPLGFPLLLGLVQVGLALTGAPGIDAGFWLRLIVALDALYAALGLMLIEVVFIGE